MVDGAALGAIRDHPEVARFQSWDRWTQQDSDALIRQMLITRPDMPGSWYQFGVALRNSNDLIGDCGFRAPADCHDQAEIGFTLAPAYWGQGYAREAVAALAEWLFTVRRKKRLFAVVDGRNFRSHALLRGIHFERNPKYDRWVWFKGGFTPEAVFERHRSPI